MFDLAIGLGMTSVDVIKFFTFDEEEQKEESSAASSSISNAASSSSSFWKTKCAHFQGKPPRIVKY